MHSVFSDGSNTIFDIFKIAKGKNLSALAVTDHDTVLGLKEVEKQSKNFKIPFIPGIEITAKENGIKFHVLGYGIDIKSEELIDYSKALLTYLNNRSLNQIRLMQRDGIKIDEKEFFKKGQGGPLYRAKLLQTLVDYGFIKQEEVMSSLKKYFGKNAPYYIEDTYKYKSMEETSKIIRQNGGVVVLAHPTKIKKKSENLYRELINTDLIDGIEIYHPSIIPEVKEELEQIAKRKDLIVTGGSDNHGKYSSYNIPIGGMEIPELVYNDLAEFLI